MDLSQEQKNANVRAAVTEIKDAADKARRDGDDARADLLDRHATRTAELERD